MTVNTPASNDDTEFESTPIPGPPGATTDNTLRQMMMTEYMRRLGPNGNYACLVTRPAGLSLSDAKNRSWIGLFQIDVARALAAQFVTGHVHGDFHRGNILFQSQFNFDKLSTKELYDLYEEPGLELVDHRIAKCLCQGPKSCHPTYLAWGINNGRMRRMLPLEQSDRDALLAMLRPMLSFSPENRSSAQQVLESEWMIGNFIILVVEIRSICQAHFVTREHTLSDATQVQDKGLIAASVSTKIETFRTFSRARKNH
ncbi:protein kinase [Histoplasma capsulatum G186AR]|uniref:Protein kinase n=1 Tax=Ajellomyces capsulatus (strain G186AR / H82 / ATCC MYA-2454 / RMSCC 2432) TaxID=447093 RepID=C0NFG1_AJECG|nr:protein kinase [Histoplasma capsulatum G186AR]EEH09982.1 protein kinase [Histoplasma capsulatum G186AR]